MAVIKSSESSGEKTESALVYSGLCKLTAIQVITDGTNAATCTVYDGTSASGTKIGEYVVAGADNYGGRLWTFPLQCATGLYIAISGTGASFIAEYIPG